MLIKRNSIAYKVLYFVGSPTKYLPALFYVVPARVGADVTTWARVTRKFD